RGERALSRPCWADDANDLAGWYIEADVVQHFRPIDAVPEGDMLEGEITTDRWQSSSSGIEGWLCRGIEDVAQPCHRQARLVKILPDLGETQHRRAHPSSQHVEGNKLAHREVAIDDELGTKEQHPSGHQFAHELDRLARHISEAEHSEACRDIARELLLPATLHLRLDRH